MRFLREFTQILITLEIESRMEKKIGCLLLFFPGRYFNNEDIINWPPRENSLIVVARIINIFKCRCAFLVSGYRSQ